MRAVAVAVALIAGPLLVIVPADAAVVRCDGHRATIVGTSAAEVLVGTPGDDVIAAMGGSDTIHGRGGSDRICGGFGADRISGGRGDDRLFGGRDRISRTDEETSRTGDMLRGGPGSDRLVPGRDNRPAVDVNNDAIFWDTARGRMFIDVAAGVATGQGRDTFVSRDAWVVGSRFADVVEGSPGADLINGGRGSDVLRGHAGDDRVVADLPGRRRPADDRVSGGRGDDELTSTAGEDTIRGGPGDDVIDDFGRSADRLFGNAGRDLLIGQLADNGEPQGYAGGPGVDRLALFSTLLNPTAAPSRGTWNMRTGRLVFELTGPVVVSVLGIERADLSTFGTTWVVRGSDGADHLSAAGTAGTIFRALGGDDSFFGSASDDRFVGGPGTDRSLGMGAGQDTCVGVEVLELDDCEEVSH